MRQITKSNFPEDNISPSSVIVSPHEMSRMGCQHNSSHLCFTSEGAKTCEAKDVCSQKGILLPLFVEVTWSWEVRVVLYFVGLVYSFVAVNIIADIFMCSIEAITSKTKTVKVMGSDGKEETLEVPVWNGTLANLVLMSLGPRSAPEILLAVVGIVANGFQQDALGPSLIVGSGAFNLLFLTAIRYCQYQSFLTEGAFRTNTILQCCRHS